MKIVMTSDERKAFLTEQVNRKAKQLRDDIEHWQKEIREREQWIQDASNKLKEGDFKIQSPPWVFVDGSYVPATRPTGMYKYLTTTHNAIRQWCGHPKQVIELKK